MRTRTASRVAICACVLALLAGCDAPAPAPSISATTVARTGDGVLRIGTLFPVSGSISFMAPAQAAGVSLAVADINAAGGVRGTPVVVLPRDSGDATTSTSQDSFADLVANSADVVIGPSTSALAQRLIPISTADTVPLISPAATFPTLSGAEAGYFFRTIPSYQSQGSALGVALSASGASRVASVYVADDLGAALEPVLADAVAGAGSTLVLSEGVTATGADLGSVIAHVAAAAPDAVVLGSSYGSLEETTALIGQLVAAGFGGSKLWLTTQNTGDYSQTFPAGTLAGVNGIVEGARPDDAFVARLKSVDAGLTDVHYAAEAYDATIVAALAAVSADDDSGEAVARGLRAASSGGIKCTSFAECLDVMKTQPDIDYDGMSGALAFAANGDVSAGSYGLYSYDGENRFAFVRGVTAD